MAPAGEEVSVENELTEAGRYKESVNARAEGLGAGETKGKPRNAHNIATALGDFLCLQIKLVKGVWSEGLLEAH